MAESKIEWTDRSDWNPVRGCTRVSPGCGGPGHHGGCYAEAIAGRFSDPGQAFHGFATRTSAGGRWTGMVEVQYDRLELPLSWRKPATIFANSTSDFFHQAIALHDIALIFGVAIAAHHLRGHVTQILTKRADRMREVMNSEEFWEIANAEASRHVMERTDPLNRRSDDARATLDDYGPSNPPPGVWLGTSVEDQQRADERVPHLLATPAAVRFLSCEPLLGPIELTGPIDRWLADYYADGGARDGALGNIHWVIAGGESGPNARPMHPDWARSLRDQCADAGVPFHFKQWGEWELSLDREKDDPDWRADYTNDYVDRGKSKWLNLEGGCGFHGERFVVMRRAGKKAAGRLLDGVEHNGVPA